MVMIDLRLGNSSDADNFVRSDIFGGAKDIQSVNILQPSLLKSSVLLL